ncbi:helicase [Burkholderia multivorans]|uniref:DEAD/DEAH box helicase n=1 Tax=Burkholderia multivorans TaxID=87883 RepID=UPI0009E0D33E|nr:helicase-related protein [Burkholderia multivorans]AYY98694.1 helicase [Burkholderia multivorans]SAK14096.1 SNF2-like protein [Burkholderia multivorans]
MPLLTDLSWQSKYDPDDGSLIEQFYVHALSCAQRYDRTTGYFTATALAIAARGIEGLVLNSGRMRMVVGCTLDEAEVNAIERGQTLRDTVEAKLLAMPVRGESVREQEALALLAWMVARGYLEIKVAVPCDAHRNPVSSQAIFHEKAGIIEDKTGSRLAFAGSVNETAYGWLHNWESFHVFCDWEGDQKHVEEEERTFARLWANKAKRAVVIDVPSAVRENVLRFLPPGGEEPERLKRARQQRADACSTEDELPRQTPVVKLPSVEELRRDIWQTIWATPRLPGGERIAEATSAITPWPHQVRAFQRMLDHWPPRLLIADEVGLGKTIEAGLLLRFAWLSGRAKRILVLAPKAVMTQWQIELREKFNLNWPIYDGKRLTWYPSPMLRGNAEKDVSRDEWHHEPFVIASSHLMRRRDRQRELLDVAEPWDLVVLDEAHHARRKSPGGTQEGPPNLLLQLMQRLQARTQGLLLLTATPMQVHPVEVWDLLALLAMPQEWSRTAFLEFFRKVGNENPSHDDFEFLARLFRAAETAFGEVRLQAAQRRAPGNSALKAKRILRSLRESASTPRRQLSAEERRSAVSIMRAYTPVAGLVSRHTRDLLREYHRRGMLGTPIASREVVDEFLDMTDEEARVYGALEAYISTTYNNAQADKRTAVGFVMTIYRKRLASSFYALRRTLEERLAFVKGQARLPFDELRSSEDAEDDVDETGDTADDEVVDRQKEEALQLEEQADIADLLAQVRRLPVDTKAKRLADVLRALQTGSYHAMDHSLLPAYPQAIVFTQYTDTLDYLRDFLKTEGFSVLCYSGRGGEWLQPDGQWKTLTREETKRRFKAQDAQVLVCTDAAAEGLNFQFCGALVNFDCPWNPMRIEQRIGRVDRLGQAFPRIAVVNLMYEGTVETDVYRALRTRINLFTSIVGPLQPILATMPARIAEVALASPGRREQARANLVSQLHQAVSQPPADAFSLDEALEAALEMSERAPAPYGLEELGLLLDRAPLLPDGSEAHRVSSKEVFWAEPGAPRISVTTDPDFFDEHPESVEFWTPGSPAFPRMPTNLEIPEEIGLSLQDYLRAG